MKASLLKQYFNNQLTEEQEHTIEKALLKAKLKEDYDTILQEEGLADMAFLTEIPSTAPSPLRPIWRNPRLWAIAATMLLLIGFSWFLWVKPVGNTDELAVLVQTELSNRFDAPVTRLTSSPSRKEWEDAKQAYQNGKFEAAAQTIETLVLHPGKTQELAAYMVAGFSPENPDTALFYLALCRLYQPVPAYSEAIKHLTTLTEKNKTSQESSFKEESLWFLTLAHLKNGDTLKARQTLTQFRELRAIFKQQEADKLWELLTPKK